MQAVSWHIFPAAEDIFIFPDTSTVVTNNWVILLVNEPKKLKNNEPVEVTLYEFIFIFWFAFVPFKYKNREFPAIV
jgi:hypothetical protein